MGSARRRRTGPDSALNLPQMSHPGKHAYIPRVERWDLFEFRMDEVATFQAKVNSARMTTRSWRFVSVEFRIVTRNIRVG